MADHPLLLRSNYTDQKVREIAKLLKRYYPVRHSPPLLRAPSLV
jgi:hypothetical protein